MYHRRANPRAEPDQDIYTFWSCNGPGVVSRVRNLNVGGVFIETGIRKALGDSVKLYFLQSEGQICAKAVVRHVETSQGLGLKFTTLDDQDRLRFVALMKRLYSKGRAAAPL